LEEDPQLGHDAMPKRTHPFPIIPSKTGSQILPENFLFIFSSLAPKFRVNAIGRV